MKIHYPISPGLLLLIFALALGTGPAWGAFTWDLAADFLPWPDQMNPNPDSLDRPVWHFLYNTQLTRDPAAYLPMETFRTSMFNIEGLNEWCAPGFWDEYWNHYSPSVGINATGWNVPYPIPWKGGGITLSSGGWLEIVGWRSPFTGTVKVSAEFIALESGGLVDWFVARGAQALASGTVGGGQPAAGGVNGMSIAVTEGEFLYFSIDPAGTFAHDSTALNLAITTDQDVTPPSVPTGPGTSSGIREVTVFWSPSTDDAGVAGYRIYRDGMSFADIPSPPASGERVSYRDTLVEEYEIHAYAVEAYDAAGNRSAPSASINATPLSTVHVESIIPSVQVDKAARAERLTFTVTLHPPAESRSNLVGGRVDAKLTLPNKAVLSLASETDPGGMGSFSYGIPGRTLAPGTYTLSITGVTPPLDSGFVYDPTQDKAASATYVKTRK